MELSFDCKSAEISANNYKTMSVVINDAEASDILNHFSSSEIVEHFGYSDLLDKIGIDKAQEYFDLVEKD